MHELATLTMLGQKTIIMENKDYQPNRVITCDLADLHSHIELFDTVIARIMAKSPETLTFRDKWLLLFAQ